jgi:hypothetical protein
MLEMQRKFWVGGDSIMDCVRVVAMGLHIGRAHSAQTIPISSQQNRLEI